MQTTGTASVALGWTIAVSVGISIVSVAAIMGVEVDCSSEVAMIGGNGVGVDCSGDLVSASESKIPPTTNNSEMMAITSPPPI